MNRLIGRMGNQDNSKKVLVEGWNSVDCDQRAQHDLEKGRKIWFYTRVFQYATLYTTFQSMSCWWWHHPSHSEIDWKILMHCILLYREYLWRNILITNCWYHALVFVLFCFFLCFSILWFKKKKKSLIGQMPALCVGGVSGYQNMRCSKEI